jgi:transcriptional regulator with XRE-family HTH domain/predicted GIY-YIG superfamily endonuclease
MTTALGRALRRAREREGLTQQALADKLTKSVGAKVWPANIAQWEAGDRVPPDSYIPKIEEILGPITKRAAKKEKDAEIIEDESSDFGVWMRNTREEKGLSRYELARQAGLTATTIYFIESGKVTNPQDATKDKIYKVLGKQPPKQHVTMRKHPTYNGKNVHGFNVTDQSDWPAEGSMGVYVLYDKTHRPIYVGRSKHIGHRLIEHRDHEPKEFDKWFDATAVYGAYIEVADEKSQVELEWVMIRFLKDSLLFNIKYTEPEEDED